MALNHQVSNTHSSCLSLFSAAITQNVDWVIEEECTIHSSGMFKSMAPVCGEFLHVSSYHDGENKAGGHYRRCLVDSKESYFLVAWQ